MAIRILFLVICALVTIPLLTLDLSCISAPDNWLVAAGLAGVLSLIAAWYGLIRWIVKWVAWKFRNPTVLCLLLVGAFLTTGCGRTVITPGHVGIRVNAYGEDRGVSSYPVTTGVVWYNPITTSVLEYPTFVQTAVWTANTQEGKPVNEEISFNTADQMVVFADISVGYHLDATKVPAFYVKFRNNDINEFTHGFFRNLTRQKFDNVAGKYKIETIMGDNAPFLAEVRNELQEELRSIGVEIDQFGFANAPRPPKQVQEAIDAKTQATQLAITTENQVRQAEAEAKKRVATAEGDAKAAIARADGEAKANQIISNSITPNILEFRRLQIQQQGIARWNGAMPQLVGSGAVPFIQVPK